MNEIPSRVLRGRGVHSSDIVSSYWPPCFSCFDHMRNFVATDCSLVKLWLFPFLPNFRLGIISVQGFFFDWIRSFLGICFIIKMKMKV